MKNSIRIFAVVSAVVLFMMPVFSQGLYWESKMVISMMPDKEIVSKIYYVPKMFKQSRADQGEDVIVRLDKELIISVNNKDTTYSELSFADLGGMTKKAGGKLSKQMAEMEKELEKLPPEQRKMVEQMMGSKMGGKKSEGKVEVSKTGEKKTISGYSCSEYIAKQDGKQFLTAWTTKDVKGLETMGKELAEFNARIAELNPMVRKEMAEAIKRIEGFPIETETEQMKTVITKIEKRAIPASEFDVPKGYKKVKPPMMPGENED